MVANCGWLPLVTADGNHGGNRQRYPEQQEQQIRSGSLVFRQMSFQNTLECFHMFYSLSYTYRTRMARWMHGRGFLCARGQESPRLKIHKMRAEVSTSAAGRRSAACLFQSKKRRTCR